MSMKKDFEEDGQIKGSNLRKLLVHLVNNRSAYAKKLNFYGYLMQLISGFFPCSCCCKGAKRKRKLFEHGTKEFFHEMDIVGILRSIRLTKMYFGSTLTA